MSGAGDAMAWLVAHGLALLGMAALAAAMDRHHEQLTGRCEVSRASRWVLRVAGGLLLGGSLHACVSTWGASVGAIAWCGFLTMGASLVVLWLTLMGAGRAARRPGSRASR